MKDDPPVKSGGTGVALTRSDNLRFCFISLGILLHATNETMTATMIPMMVDDLSGVEYVGWSLAAYELGAIAAGAAAGRLVSYISLRANLMLAAFLFAAGTSVCAAAPTMMFFLAGRLLSGLGGGALVSLAYVAVERLFPQSTWPRLFGVVAAVWGVAAFGGPLVGALLSEALSWRWAFALFSLLGVLMAATGYFAMASKAVLQQWRGAAKAPPFPFLSLLVLVIAFILIASAGVGIELLRSSTLLIVGLIVLGLFFYVDTLKPNSRLFPSKVFDWYTPLGCGMSMFAAFAVSTCSLSVYGSLLLVSLHDVPILTIGFIIAAESVAWSTVAIVVAGASSATERRFIVSGAVMITAGIAGFGFAIGSGSLPLITACALLQGSGFGLSWSFVSRQIVASAPPEERTLAASSVPTMFRIGYALGATVAGLIANAAGFSEGFTRAEAERTSTWVFLAFLPIAFIGCAAAFALTARLRCREQAAGAARALSG
jgi:MFS family permease